MSSLTKINHSWVVEKIDSGTWLGSRDRMSGAGMSFEGRVPVMWPTLRDVREGWLRHCVDEKYLKRGITLAGPGGGAKYLPGIDFGLMPRVRFVRVSMVATDFEIPTSDELNIDEK